MRDGTDTPDLVRRAHRRAESAGFALSCEPPVGALLAALAAAVPRGGRILEIGTGAGVGLAWLVSGLGSRTDVEVVSCEVDAATAELALAEAWPAFVTVHVRSFLDLADELAPAHLLFADSGAGKWEGLELTLRAVRPGGLLVMDDMTPAEWSFPEQESLNREVAARLRSDPRFRVAELAFASGVLLATRTPELRMRSLERREISDLWSIDRAEVIENVYFHEKGELVLRREHHDVRGWPPGEPARDERILRDCFDHGGTFLGAFDGETLVGAMVLESRFIGPARDELQLKFLHVSRSHRQTGLGRLLFEKGVARARELGARRLYISATPSQNTVHFYLRRGCRVADGVDPDLFELEPDDIHLHFDIPA